MRFLLLALPAALSACAPDDKVAENAQVPPLHISSETPGDWSALEQMVGRRPFESGLLDNSPISVDLNALLGPDAGAFRSAMTDAGPLRREGELLVASSRSGKAWLVLQPRDHALRAALRQGSGWREWQTAGAEVPRAPGA